jgi:hypothetical protein
MSFYEPGITREEAYKRDLERYMQENPELEEPYTVEQTEEQTESGCEHCGAGKMWLIIDPDGIAGGTSYGDKEEADDLAQELNRAFHLGQAKERAGVSWYDRELNK